MTYKEVADMARGNIGPYCKSCYVCDGKACRNTMPGPGAKGRGDVAIRNYQKWQEIRVNMDTISENVPVDTSADILGRKYSVPVFAGPVGAVKLHYGDRYTDLEYNEILLQGALKSGIGAFTGDGTDPLVMQSAAQSIKKYSGCGIPTVKPWGIDTIKEKFSLIKDTGCPAVAMDIDAAGLPFLKNANPPAGRKTTAQLKEIISLSPAPFIVKGVMTPSGALKAKQAGAAAIIVSNHGGRVLDGCPSTAEVLPDIIKAVGKDMTILVDGGIRSGLDVIKALALGADGVVIARPFVTAVYGAGADGVCCYVEHLKNELSDVMSMCGAKTISDINSDMLFMK